MRTALAALLVAACGAPAHHRPPPPDLLPPPVKPVRPAAGSGSDVTTAPTPEGLVAPPPSKDLTRADFNRLAVRADLPVFWIADTNHDGAPDASEVAPLLFYPTKFDGNIAAAERFMLSVAADHGDKRRELAGKDLDQGRASLVLTDFTGLSADDKAFVGHMLAVAAKMDALYDKMTGAAALAGKVASDPESQSLFRRNRGPRCVGPSTEGDAACSAIPGATKPVVDVYPETIYPGQMTIGLDTPPVKQGSAGFCAKIEADKGDKLLDPFTVVREIDGKLTAVPYTVAYKDDMAGIADELAAAAAAMKDPKEKPLVAYLTAAAKSFRTNDWLPADEAWAKMGVDNSKWYVRAAPDETYWEPCSHKAGMHLTFARINQGSIAWQKKLTPIQQDMEAAIAAKAGKPYKARSVKFHLPDFIDIVVNAGDDRNPLGATIGESLPNWGPVANGGRGRTVAMVNLYQDPDSRDARRGQAESLLDGDSMLMYTGTQEPGLLGTILHEATHNLGPAHEYKAPNTFDGPIASMLEELKAQTGALFLLDFLHGKKLLTDDEVVQSFTDDIVWAFGHVSQGMYTGDKVRKTYGNVAAIQIGYLIDNGVLTWDPNAMAANGKDRGAFHIHRDKLAAVADALMGVVAGIKARGDIPAAQGLIERYVDGKTVVPHDVIAERFLRFPKASFVYSVSM